MARTLYEKLWDTHLVREEPDGTALLYIDRHLVHEVTSPQAFEGLKVAHRKPWRIESVVATADHNMPTTATGTTGIADPISRLQVETLDANMREFHVEDLLSVIRPPPGHRARDRPGAGRDAARHDGRLRRLAHQHPRRLRGARLRHRHLRGRARARHAVPDAEEGEDDAVRVRGHASPPASRPRTWCSPSSAGSAPRAARATRSSSAAAPSARSPWKGA